jgi:hypothetical protein
VRFEPRDGVPPLNLERLLAALDKARKGPGA